MFNSVSLLATAALLLSTVKAQSTASQYGQCGGIGWSGATSCPAGYGCSVVNPYYSQCLPGAATPTAPSSTVSSGGAGTSGSSSPTTSASAGGALPTPLPGNSFIRSVEDPYFHQYLQSAVLGTASDAVLSDYTTAAQFQITDGQLIQQSSPLLYAVVEPRANSTVMKLKVSWSTTPATNGTFDYSGDTIEWSIPSITRPQVNAWYVCPDAEGNQDLYVNLGYYDYETPTGCADETIHFYTGATPVPRR